jgi:hypothetical protein
MRHATGAVLLVLAGAASGCCGPRWPTQTALPPSHRAIRYVAQAIKIADDRCAAEANTQVELEGCREFFTTLKPVVLKLEAP